MFYLAPPVGPRHSLALGLTRLQSGAARLDRGRGLPTGCRDGVVQVRARLDAPVGTPAARRHFIDD